MTNKLRRNLWLLTIALLALCAGVYGQVTTSFDTAGVERTMLSASMGLLGLAAVLLFPSFSTKKKTLLAIALPALAVRLLVLPASPSDDIHRYLWEGKLMEAGENPYAVTADHPSRVPFHDNHWERMNHHDQPTAYPPLALSTFSLINKLGYAEWSYKLVFTALDLALLAAILALLHHFRKPAKWSLLYALSPIAILSYSAEAHFDILMVLPLVLGVLAFTKKRYLLSGLFLALAIHFKVTVAVVVPFFLWRTPIRHWVSFIVTLAVPSYFYQDQIISMLEAVAYFGSVANFNGPSYQILLQLVEPHINEPDARTALDTKLDIVNTITAAIYSLVYLGITIYFLRKHLTAIAAATVALSALVFFSPVVHFWYLAWVLPFIALSPRVSWLSLSVTSGLYFLVWQQLATVDLWQMPLLARLLFWLPFVLLTIWKILGNKHTFATTVRDVTEEQSPDISIVIPTRNAGNGLSNALASIDAQTLPPAQIIVVDAGSTDGSLEQLTTRSNTSIIQSPTGRGMQIKTGVEVATTDWVLILHADAQLQPQSLETLQQHILTNPDLVGGCFGQRFDSFGPGLLLVEILNEIRGTYAHTSFGDQAQFLHRPTALSNDCVSDQPLMEDVELSDRLRPFGQISYLGCEVTVSAEKWRRHPFSKRFLLIVKYFFRYRLMLWKPKSERDKLAKQLVEEYYSAAHK